MGTCCRWFVRQVFEANSLGTSCWTVVIRKITFGPSTTLTWSILSLFYLFSLKCCICGILGYVTVSLLSVLRGETTDSAPWAQAGIVFLFIKVLALLKDRLSGSLEKKEWNQCSFCLWDVTCCPPPPAPRWRGMKDAMVLPRILHRYRGHDPASPDTGFISPSLVWCCPTQWAMHHTGIRPHRAAGIKPVLPG